MFNSRIFNAIKLFFAPFALLPYRMICCGGYAVDCANEAYQLISKEAKLRKIASQSKISLVDPFEKFSDLAAQNVRLSKTHWTSSHDRVEYPLLMGICAALQPRRIFEFGTFLGEATLLFALASPQSKITTINIPEEKTPILRMEEDGKPDLIPNNQIGVFFKEQPEASRIQLVLADSFDFSVKGLEHSFDFIWVDAAHSYEYVKNDSEKAFQLLKPGGYIFWHDFDSEQSGVIRALAEIAKHRVLYWINRTSIVFYHDENGPMTTPVA